MRIPSSRFTFHNHLTNNGNWPFLPVLGSKWVLENRYAPIGWCIGVDLEYAPNIERCGLMVRDVEDDNNEFWTHIPISVVGHIFGDSEGLKAVEATNKFKKDVE